jgi:hypothetical protein
MGKLPNIKQLPCNAKCGWCHKEGYDKAILFPHNICPFLYHSIYPYFLGLLYHADMQDIWVCCPAEKGVDVLVRRIVNNGKFPVPPDWWVIYAEVVNVGECPHGHTVGSELIFPTAHKQSYICPAGVNNIFPFLDIEVPSCINKKKLRCPDWKDTVFYEV